MKIKVSKPCHENWDNMTPDEKGKFCAVCTKFVYDFVNCSDDEILNNASLFKEDICGRFDVSQLNRNLTFTKVNNLFAKFAIGFVLTTVGLQEVSAQVTDSTLKKEAVKIPVIKDSSNTYKNIRIGGAKVISTNNDPLYILDKKIIKKEDFNKIDANSIEHVEVLKGEKAITLYGTSATNGAIIMTSKNKDSKEKKKD